MLDEIPLLRFAKTLAGKYSNKEQAQEHPKYFAHINIYYRPLDWSIFDGPWFYSEQSYDYMPWNPYKQAIHKLIHSKNTFIVENYSFNSPERIAGSGFKPELLEDINKQSVCKRSGCSMHFTEVNHMQFSGNIEPGNKCLINRKGVITYLMSKVKFNQETWVGLDEGIDVSTQKKVWGSEHGELKFQKIESIGINLIENWRDKLWIE